MSPHKYTFHVTCVTEPVYNNHMHILFSTPYSGLYIQWNLLYIQVSLYTVEPSGNKTTISHPNWFWGS